MVGLIEAPVCREEHLRLAIEASRRYPPDVVANQNEDDLYLIWAETGGPVIAAPPEMNGFGSRLIARSIASQLGGKLIYDWQESGLVVEVRLRADRLAD